MSGYIYHVSEYDILPDEYKDRVFTTRKYEARKFLEKVLAEGRTIGDFRVSRSRDGVPDSTHTYDVYQFMNIDLGEVL